MSTTNEYAKPDYTAAGNSTPYTSYAATSEEYPATEDRTLRKVMFAGIQTRQIEIRDGNAIISTEASALFVSRLAAAVGESIVSTPHIPHRELATSKLYLHESKAVLIEYLKELKAATRAIDEKYKQVAGLLGKPVSDVGFGGNDYEVAYRIYERGAIYVTPHGTFEVHGAIYRKYAALGAEASVLGYPETDELSTLFGTGRFNHFQRGSIYWTPQTGAWEIHGAIRNKWFQLNGDRSDLGYPISDEEGWRGPGDASRISHFQRGSLIFESGNGTVLVIHDSVMLATSLSASSVTCSAELWMNSAGHWFYKGHMHNSGFVGFNVKVASSPQFQDASGNIFVLPVERHLDGTTSFGNERDDDWDEAGEDNFIRDNWDFIRYAGMRTVMNVDVTFGDIVQLISLGLPIAVGVIIFGAIVAGGKVCGPYGHMRRNPETHRDEPSVTFELVDKDEQCRK